MFFSYFLISLIYSLFHSFCNMQVGELNLPLSRTGAGELLSLVGTVQIPPHAGHLPRNLKATIFLCYNLRKRQKITNDGSFWSGSCKRSSNLKKLQTFRMWSLGSRLQSAKLSSGPSRKLLVDSGTSPKTSASISSDRGVLRKSSRRWRDFNKAFCKATEVENTLMWMTDLSYLNKHWCFPQQPAPYLHTSIHHFRLLIKCK